ncbi:MAG: GFA family protein [Devosia sp.]|uniref:GFA family protein n=1 Tax=Devosia sp. 66-22 TaxID=1895753 RepID=UPI00092C5FC0|nr:GFA family protein [Devosia sp. 66-22]MBN9346005.1 GFA family protein [Devosia sp.]OJX53072.1 MAG: aldehyde-activating protein [Devosia sp. 66-22]
MTLIAACHCGHTRIELPAQPTHAKSCNCTYCARTGAVWAYYKPGELTFLSREGEATYSPSGMNHHHFCANCGMQTWGDSPDWASLYNNDGTPKNGEANAMPTERIHAVNLRLIDDLDWDAVTVEAVDGRASW